MSSTARQIATVARTRLGPLGTALDRARLTVVPRGRTNASRVRFVALVTVVLLGGVVGLLMFNTSMQQAAFSEAKLNEQATNLAARQQSLQMQLQTMSDPQVIAQKAERQHMVIPGSPVLLTVPSGKVSGVGAPANRANTPPLWPSNPKPHARVIKVAAPPTTPSTAAPTTPSTAPSGTPATPNASRPARRHASEQPGDRRRP